MFKLDLPNFVITVAIGKVDGPQKDDESCRHIGSLNYAKRIASLKVISRDRPLLLRDAAQSLAYEILGFFQLLLLAGSETTTNLINNAILCFLDHPEQLARLGAEPGLLPSAIEEVLRWQATSPGSRGPGSMSTARPVCRSVSNVVRTWITSLILACGTAQVRGEELVRSRRGESSGSLLGRNLGRRAVHAARLRSADRCKIG